MTTNDEKMKLLGMYKNHKVFKAFDAAHKMNMYQFINGDHTVSIHTNEGIHSAVYGFNVVTSR